MAQKQSTKKRREELREMGYRPVDLWLHKDQIDKVDEIAKKQRVSRSKAIEILLGRALASLAPFGAPDDFS